MRGDPLAGEDAEEEVKGKQRRVDPGQPLHLQGQDTVQQHLQVGVQGGEGKEHGHVDVVHGGAAHQEAHQNIQHHAQTVEDGKAFSTTPRP